MRIRRFIFTTLQQPIAQVPLTRTDLVQRSHYINAYNTFQELLSLMDLIVNENDTVAVESLAIMWYAGSASLVEARLAVLLTDVDRVLPSWSAFVPNAQPITLVKHVEQLAQFTGTNRYFQSTGYWRYGYQSAVHMDCHCCWCQNCDYWRAVLVLKKSCRENCWYSVWTSTPAKLWLAVG